MKRNYVLNNETLFNAFSFIRTLRIRREQVLQDMIQVFSFDEIMNCSIKVVMVDARGNDEMGEDEKGIYRDATACFWHQF